MTSVAKTIFKLGQVSFSVESEDTDFVADIEKLFFEAPIPCEDNVLEVSTSSDVRLLLNEILNQHSHCIWVDAACIVSNSGKKILISGLSGAGKSTTAMAMVWGHNWKALGEDLVLIDPATEEIISFPSPFSLKSGTTEILQHSISNLPAPILRGEWVPYRPSQIAQNSSAIFDYVFHFDSAKSGKPFAKQSITAAEYLRCILPCSNLMHYPDAFNLFLGYLNQSNCFKVVGGTLDERIALISDAGSS